MDEERVERMVNKYIHKINKGVIKDIIKIDKYEHKDMRKIHV